MPPLDCLTPPLALPLPVRVPRGPPWRMASPGAARATAVWARVVCRAVTARRMQHWRPPARLPPLPLLGVREVRDLATAQMDPLAPAACLPLQAQRLLHCSAAPQCLRLTVHEPAAGPQATRLLAAACPDFLLPLLLLCLPLAPPPLACMQVLPLPTAPPRALHRTVRQKHLPAAVDGCQLAQQLQTLCGPRLLARLLHSLGWRPLATHRTRSPHMRETCQHRPAG